MRYFVAVAEEENVSRAALKLRVSQPGISRQIHDLEDEIGFELFERSAKSVRLTAAGRVFLDEAGAVLRRAGEAVEKARAVAGGTTGEINIGYAPSLTVRILPPALRKFQEQFPKARVALHDLSSGEMLARLRDGKLQVALTVRPPARQMRGFQFEELASYGMRVAVAPKHPLAKSKSVTLEQMAREPMIAYSRNEYPEYHATLDELFAPAGRKPLIAGEHDGVASLIAAVESGRGFALVPESLTCMVGERLKLIPISQPPPPIPVGALWRDNAASGLARHFITAARAAANEA